MSDAGSDAGGAGDAGAYGDLSVICNFVEWNRQIERKYQARAAAGVDVAVLAMSLVANDGDEEMFITAKALAAVGPLFCVEDAQAVADYYWRTGRRYEVRLRARMLQQHLKHC